MTRFILLSAAFALDALASFLSWLSPASQVAVVSGHGNQITQIKTPRKPLSCAYCGSAAKRAHRGSCTGCGAPPLH